MPFQWLLWKYGYIKIMYKIDKFHYSCDGIKRVSRVPHQWAALTRDFPRALGPRKIPRYGCPKARAEENSGHPDFLKDPGLSYKQLCNSLTD